MQESEHTTTDAEAAETLDIDGMIALHAGEMRGEAFYNAFADTIDNEEAAELLRRNGREEAGHARRLARALEIKMGEPFVPPVVTDDAEPMTLPEPTPEFFAMVADGERKGDTMYATYAENEPDSEVARLYRLNGREETLHAGRIEAVAALLNPTA
ncbi:MAG: ferritin family protein [Acidimicrobiia bacterium]